MDSVTLELYKDDLKDLGIDLSDEQINQFVQYYEILMKWNEVMNLTAITQMDEVLKKHFVDSLALVKVCPWILDGSKSCTLLDVGTGAGFPGIPLKIAFPQLHVTLLDSLQKRIHFLDEVIGKLSLSEVNTIHGRAEDYAKPSSLREKYDICVSRAVAGLSVLSEYCLPFVKVGGVFVSYKGDKIEEEMKAAKEAIYILGGKVEEEYRFKLPFTEIGRTFVLIRKERKTPKKYPRKAGLPSKEPI